MSVFKATSPHQATLVLLLFLLMIGCGVKGRPLPPLSGSPVLGDGKLRGEKKKTSGVQTQTLSPKTLPTIEPPEIEP